MNGTWLHPHVEELKTLWARGDSCSAIAKHINRMFGTGYSRNAIIGKASRLHLPMRVGSIKDDGTKLRTIRARRSVWMVNKRREGKAKKGNQALRELLAADGYVPPAEEIVIPIAERKTVQTLEEHHCRWPIGDPQAPDFHFCGKTKIQGLSYCECHARRAYSVSAPMKFIPFPVGPRKEKVDA